MCNTGTIQTSITLPIDLWNEMEKTRDGNRSYFIQSALRLKIQSLRKENIKLLLKNIDEKDLQILKNEIKKRG